VPDLLDELVYLSNFLGQDSRLVQPGGGNTSAKLRLTSDSGEPVQALAVKGSGTDLRTIGPDGFTWLSIGSNGRREAVPSSDVDSAVSFESI